MEKIKRLILLVVPNQVCNLKCEYCYISQVDDWKGEQKMTYSPEYIAKCLSAKRLGGICLINLTGNGETMLQTGIVEIIDKLLKEGHFVEVVTNGTVTKRIQQVLQLPKSELSRLFFKISFHYKELLKLNMMDVFFKNVNEIQKAGVSFTLELMAYDGIENEITHIKKICKEKTGAVCHATIGRDDTKRTRGLLSKHDKETYQKIWEGIESPMLDFKLQMLGQRRKEFCYAGEWSLFVNLYTGEAQPCYRQPYNQNIFKNPDKPIYFSPVGHFCNLPYCVNAHAHIAWGDIPEFEQPLYCDMRNRVCDNGEEWLNPQCKEFFSSKLYETNETHNKYEQIILTVTYPIKFLIWSLRHPAKGVERVKKYILHKSKRDE